MAHTYCYDCKSGSPSGAASRATLRGVIVSHQHRFIFLKTRKTAGTSIEIALSRYCGPDDIITPLHPDDEDVRREFGGRAPQHHEGASNHMRANHVRDLVGRRVWRSYYRFAVERDPWDVVLSSLNRTRQRRDPTMTVSDFINSPIRLSKVASNGRVYRIGGKIAVTQLCRYETLSADLETAWTAIGLPLPVELPDTKSTASGPRLGRDAFSPDDVETVRRAFAATIDAMGYEFTP
jgi:hypothetical protein